MKYLGQCALGFIVGFVLFFALKIIVSAIVGLFVILIGVGLWIYFKPDTNSKRIEKYL